MHIIHNNLHALKSKVHIWERTKKKAMCRDLQNIVVEIERLGKIMDRGNPSPSLIEKLKELEENKRNILHI